MKNLVKLPTLFKRDTTGKIRMWEVEYDALEAHRRQAAAVVGTAGLGFDDVA